MIVLPAVYVCVCVCVCVWVCMCVCVRQRERHRHIYLKGMIVKTMIMLILLNDLKVRLTIVTQD